MELNLENATLEEVRVAMDCTPTKKGFRRLLALRWLYEGKSREEVAALSFFSARQVLRFIHAFNLAGLDGLIPGRSSGRRRILPKEQVAEKIVPVIEDPSLAGQTHWTAVKLHGWIKEHLQAQLGYSTTVRYLHEQDYKLKVPRPWPLHQDAEQREAFCEKLCAWQQDEYTDVWFCDESGFEGDPRPRRTWTKIGKVRVSPYLGEHIRHNVFGAVRPADGRLCAMLFNLCDSQPSRCSSTPWRRKIHQWKAAVPSSCSTTPRGTRSSASTGITSSRSICRHARPISTPSRGCGCG